MSLPYPNDRARARQDKGEQPYKDAREAMTEKEAKIQSEAEAFGEANLRPTDEERVETQRSEAEARLAEVGADRNQPSRSQGDSMAG